MTTKKITLNELRGLFKQIIKEDVSDNTGSNIKNQDLIGIRTHFKCFGSVENKKEILQKINLLFNDHHIDYNIYDDKLRGKEELEIEILPKNQSTLSLKSTNDKLENLKSIGLIRNFKTSKRQY
jgi:hypothetical protein